jgi:hypothetical protein
VIVDSTPPSVDYVGAGMTIDKVYLSGQELSVLWEGVEDSESGILMIEVRHMFLVEVDLSSNTIVII